MRIVSLVPSLTETICHFGLQEHLVGCTHYCTEPKSLRKTVPAVGGTKDANLSHILQLKPTHIIVNLEENTSALIQELKRRSSEYRFKLIETFLEDPEDNFTLIQNLSEHFEFSVQGAEWIERQRSALYALRETMSLKPPFTFAYFIWMNPWMVAGNRTYISKCLSLIGGQNVIETGTEPTERYPIVEPSDAVIQNADWLLFSSEPFPFKNRHIEKYLTESGLNQPTMKVDGQALSWYGSRFEKTLLELESLRVILDKN